MHGHRVGIIINRQRYLCKDCGSTFREILWDIDEDHMCTVRFKEYVQEQSLKRTFTSIADELGISEGTVRNIFNKYIEFLEETHSFVTPRWMGIDEIHILGKPRCVIANVEENVLVDLLVDRNKDTVIRYLSRLKNDRFLMLKRRKDLTPMEQIILDSWTLNFPLLKQAYELKEAFYEIWEANDAKEAQERYAAWQASIPDGMKSAFSDIIKAYGNWQHEINNYFTHRVTNAYTESINGLTRVVNRMGRGYSFKALRAKMLYSEGLHRKAKTNYKKSVELMYSMLGNSFKENEEQTVILGADISILTKRIEERSL